MNDTKPKPVDQFKLVARIEALRSDQRGSLTLLAGMMIFLVTIFGVIAFDTNMAIYDRIVAQNAVDAAADSAALWQARGCNLQQKLNDLHWKVDTAGCIAESLAEAACALAAVETALLAVPIADVAAEAALPPTCFVGCDPLPVIDVGQHIFYDALMPIQQGIVTIWPLQVYAKANECAEGSGADYLPNVVTHYTGGLLSALGVGNIDLGSIPGAGSLPIYAFPINPLSLQLYVDKKDNNGDMPLKYPSWIPSAANDVGEVVCAEYGYDIASEAHQNSEGDDRDNSDGYHPNWGWNDQYFYGNPQYMTWIAGKDQRDELLGLGKLAWLNGGQKTADEVSKVMYIGGVNATGGTPLTIPAFIAIASSQSEGDAVMHYSGDVNNFVWAHPQLIKVYLSGETTVNSIGIYH